MNPFDYVKSILETKNNLIVNEATEKAYVPFLTNRASSYYIDTVMHAQEMNMASHLDNCLQYRYYINTVIPMKRKYAKVEGRKVRVMILILFKSFLVTTIRKQRRHYLFFPKNN